ncbi:hypothetical protein Droror1_Dr00019648 [Drosera rotundifolia]
MEETVEATIQDGEIVGISFWLASAHQVFLDRVYAAMIFGNALKLKSLKPEKKLMWKKEMGCLLSVCDYIVELVPPSVNEPELETRHWEQQI